MSNTMSRCYACDRKLGANPYVADTRDDQFVYVGSECFKYIRQSGEMGYQPPKGGPRLYLIPRQSTPAQLHVSAASIARSIFP